MAAEVDAVPISDALLQKVVEQVGQAGKKGLLVVSNYTHEGQSVKTIKEYAEGKVIVADTILNENTLWLKCNPPKAVKVNPDTAMQEKPVFGNKRNTDNLPQAN